MADRELRDAGGGIVDRVAAAAAGAENRPVRPLREDAAQSSILVFVGLAVAQLALERLGLIDYRQALIAQLAYVALAAMVWLTVDGERGLTRFGLANRVTLARGAVVAALFGLWTGDLSAQLLWLAAAAAILVAALDGVDGHLARARGESSAFGARFDMEVDALLVLVLALLLKASGHVGAWILLAGALRYLFVAAGWIAPALAAPLPPSRRRRAICIVQVLAFALALMPPFAVVGAWALAALGLAAALYSFAIDITWLLRHRNNGANHP